MSLDITTVMAEVKPLIDKFNEKRTFRTFVDLVWNAVPIVEKVCEEINIAANSPELKGKSKEDILVALISMATPNFPFKGFLIRMIVKQAVAFFNKNGWTL